MAAQNPILDNSRTIALKSTSGIISLITWIIRLTTGATFIVSGFVKAIDPHGTYYKLVDYMGAMHLPAYHNILIVCAFSLFTYEFIVGIFLITGCFRRSAPIFAAIFMAVMLPLTFWIAIWNPVADCGCFGDAFILSNWATFWKNVVLTLCVIWLLKFNSICRCLIMPSIQWIAFIISGGYIIIIGAIGYIYQPLLDFRPYPIGETLIESTSEDDSAIDDDTLYVYTKDGVEKKFSINDNLPDEESGWEFVRRENQNEGDNSLSNPEEGLLGKDKNFRIWSEDGKDDITEDVLSSEERQILLLMPDLKDVSISGTWQINSLYDWAMDNDIDFVGIVNGNQNEIENWKDLSLAYYPIFTADETELKMIARGNPAIVYVDHGKIKWKSTLRAMEIKDFQSKNASSDPESYARDDKAILYNTSGTYVALMALLICFSIIPFRRLFSGLKKQI